MDPTEEPQGAQTRKLWQRCASIAVFLVKLVAYLCCCFGAAQHGFWMRFHQYNATCRYPALPANQSGVKVMIAGFAKMGTRTLSRTLFELGYEHSYHGEEYLQYVWHPISYEYWARPENGGLAVAPIGSLFRSQTTDLEVLASTPPELLAARTSSCRTDAVALDGAEALFWPLMQVSPDAKVLVLNWRTFGEAGTAFRKFTRQLFPYLYMVGSLDVGLHLLPWPLLFHALEPLFGRPAKQSLETGRPAFNQVETPYYMSWVRHNSMSRFCGHWLLGLSQWSALTEAGYGAFFERIKREVPPARRLDFDPRKTTYEDLCRFLQLEPCKKSGRIPRAINLGNHELDFFPAYAMLMPMHLTVHWCNWNFIHWLSWQVWLGLLGVRKRAQLGRAKAA